MQDIFDHILDELYERARMYVESVRRLTLGEVSNLSHWQNTLSLNWSSHAKHAYYSELLCLKLY